MPANDAERTALVERLTDILRTHGDRDHVPEDDVETIDRVLRSMMRFYEPHSELQDNELAEAVQRQMYGAGRRLKDALATYRFRTQYPALTHPPREEYSERRTRMIVKASPESRTVLKTVATGFAACGAAYIVAAMFGVPLIWWALLLVLGLAAAFGIWFAATAPEEQEYYRDVPISAGEQAIAISTALKNYQRVLALVNKNLIQARPIAPFSCSSVSVFGNAANPTSVTVQFTVQAPYETVNGTQYEEEVVETWNYVTDDLTDDDLVKHFTRGMKKPLDQAMHRIATRLGIGTGFIAPREHYY